MEIKKLKDLCIGKGEYGIAAPAEPFSESKYRYLRITDISDNGTLLSDDPKSVSCPGCEKCILQENDIVFARTGNSTGRAFFYEPKYGELVYAGFLIKFHLDDTKVTPKYMKYYTISQTYRNWVNNGPTGSTRGNMSEGDFADMPVFLPSRKQQDAIVNLFSPFDEKIDNNNAIAAELEGMAKDLYDYWFVQFDFPDENGKPYKSSGGKMVWNEELKREIPEGWEVYQLDELFRFVKGRIPTEVFDTNDGNNLIPYLTIKAVNAVPTSYCKKQGMITTAGDTIMVMDGAASSETYVGHYGALGSTFAKLEKVNGRVTDSFVYVIMQKYQSVFKKVNTGSTVPHANKDYISKFKVVLPQDDCLKNMAIKFDTWVQKQIQVREENAELTSLRDFLLPMLMSGQVKVKGRDI